MLLLLESKTQSGGSEAPPPMHFLPYYTLKVVWSSDSQNDIVFMHLIIFQGAF